jgi:site-specific recombinase XerD
MAAKNKMKQDWNLIDLLSEDELKRLCPGSTADAARAKLVLKELKAHPHNEVDLDAIELVLEEKEGHHLNKLPSITFKDALNKFLTFSQIADSTRGFYRSLLNKALPVLGLTPKPEEIVSFRDNLKCTPGGKASYHRAMRAFFNWLYSAKSGYPNFRPEDNPIRLLDAPKVPKRKMPAQDKKTIETLFANVESIRDAAIIAVLIDTGGRRAEISNIYEKNILWDQHSIKAIAKGNREVLMPLGPISEKLLKQWLTEYHPGGGIVWGINESGIVSMLRRLEKKSGIKCNAHTFRRGFASELRRSGVDTLDIMKLGHWQSLPMVQRYTESVDFENSQTRYKAPTGRLEDSTRRLQKNELVPRPRIELGTRRFSVYCSTD